MGKVNKDFMDDWQKGLWKYYGSIIVTTPLMLEENLNPRTMEISPDSFLGSTKSAKLPRSWYMFFHPI